MYPPLVIQYGDQARSRLYKLGCR